MCKKLLKLAIAGVLSSSFFIPAKSLGGSFLGGLTPILNTNTTISLAWDASPDSQVTGYKVYYGLNRTNLTDSLDAGNALQATLSGLKKGKMYFLVVKAYNGSSMESEPSNMLAYGVKRWLVPPPPEDPKFTSTDPNELISYTTQNATNGTTIVIRSVAGQTYSIQTTEQILGEWFEIALVTATGTSFSVVDRNSLPGRFRFYRALPVVP